MFRYSVHAVISTPYKLDAYTRIKHKVHASERWAMKAYKSVEVNTCTHCGFGTFGV
jgi:hypothetical protein